MSSNKLIRRNLTGPIISNNTSLTNILETEPKLETRKSLKKLGRKKTVSFSTNISIIKVDNWKSYQSIILMFLK